MKIKKLKIKLNKDNEYSDYRYFIPKSNNIKMTDGRDVDEAVQSLKDKIANLKEQANYLIDKAPLVKYAEGTSIILTDCAEAPLKKFSIEGNSYQETREGYNKLPPMVEKTTTFQGRTYTSNGKGSLSVTGSATGSGATAFDLEKEITLGKENLYVHLLNNYATGAVGIRFLNGNTRVFEIVPTSANMITDIGTTYAGQTITAIQIYQNGSNNFDMTIQPMICTSNSSLEFEQYGVSPSIEYKAPIESVGDNINLFNKDTISSGGLSSTTGNVISNNYWNTSDYIPVNPKTTYCFSWESDNNYFQATVCYYDSDKNFISGLSLNKNTAYSNMFETVEGTCYVRVSYSFNVSGTNVTRDNIKLEKGTKATPYSPYGQGSIEIKNVNKNILKLYDIAETTRNGLTYSCINGKIKINGTATVLTNIWFNDLDIKMNVGEYTLSSNTNLQGKGSVALKDLNGNIVQTNLNTPAKITLNENRTATQFLLQISSGATFTNFEMEIQLELGSIATEYVEHQSQTKALYTQQPFKAIGDVKDRFIKKDGAWYERHYINRLILNGTESWEISTDTKFFFVTNIISSTDYSKVYCNIALSASSYAELTDGTARVAIRNNGNGIYISNTNSMTLVDWKAWLSAQYEAGTPLYVDYVLATPTLIPCTLEQIEVLDSLQSYDKITYYSVDKTNNVQANIKLIYKQDINAILEAEGV